MNYLKKLAFKGGPGDYQYKDTTFWYEILEEQVRNSARTGIHEVSGREAQELANMGYIVIGAWKNKPGKDHPPRYATVRPRVAYEAGKGPMVANVGSENDIMRARDGFFGLGNDEVKTKLEETRWYYNMKQELNDAADYLKEILKLKERER
jgi:hypothetical protein